MQSPIFLSPILCAVTLLAVACNKDQKAHDTDDKPEVVANTPQDVALVTAQASNVSEWTAITGTLIAEQRTQLSANAAGRVEATYVERGQKVKQGDMLVLLDARAAKHGAKEANANLRNLQAQRATGKRDCERYEALYKKQAISDQEYQRMMAQCRELDAQFEAAEARLADAVRTLSDGSVRAPFAGVISERTVQVGDYVQPSSPVVVLLKPDPLRLRAAVPESQASFVASGRKVVFEVAAYKNDKFEAFVQYVSGEVREASRDIVFEASAKNESGRLLPGMFASGRLYAGEKQSIIVPVKSVVKEGERSFVFRVDRGQLCKHLVRVGERVITKEDTPSDQVAIDEGLADGDRIAAVASQDLRDGQRLTTKD